MYQRIRDLREDRDLNQTEIAKYLGMSQTGYSKYETGENDIPSAVLIKLASYYNTSVDYLLGQTDEKKEISQSQITKRAHSESYGRFFTPNLNFVK